jgi:hypothetical protein
VAARSCAFRQAAGTPGANGDLALKHALSSDDRRFRAEFEACTVAPEQFNHRAHIRLAYVYLVDHGPETALTLFRAALLAFIEHYGIDVTKYHETITRAWILAVRHFMETTAPAPSADAFIEGSPVLLDTNIMTTHYSTDLLFSPEARQQFVEPDLDPIPRYGP